MPRLAPCPGCGRHVSVHEARCPFCAMAFSGALNAPEGEWGKTILRVTAMAAVASLGGCAGGISADDGAPPEPDMIVDDDDVDAGPSDAGN